MSPDRLLLNFDLRDCVDIGDWIGLLVNVLELLFWLYDFRMLGFCLHYCLIRDLVKRGRSARAHAGLSRLGTHFGLLLTRSLFLLGFLLDL